MLIYLVYLYHHFSYLICHGFFSIPYLQIKEGHDRIKQHSKDGIRGVASIQIKEVEDDIHWRIPRLLWPLLLKMCVAPLLAPAGTPFSPLAHAVRGLACSCYRRRSATVTRAHAARPHAPAPPGPTPTRAPAPPRDREGGVRRVPKGLGVRGIRRRWIQIRQVTP